MRGEVVMYQCCLGQELPRKSSVLETAQHIKLKGIHFKVYDKKSKVVVAETNNEEEAIEYVKEGQFDYQWFAGRVE